MRLYSVGEPRVSMLAAKLVSGLRFPTSRSDRFSTFITSGALASAFGDLVRPVSSLRCSSFCRASFTLSISSLYEPLQQLNRNAWPRDAAVAELVLASIFFPERRSSQRDRGGYISSRHRGTFGVRCVPASLSALRAGCSGRRVACKAWWSQTERSVPGRNRGDRSSVTSAAGMSPAKRDCSALGARYCAFGPATFSACQRKPPTLWLQLAA